MRLLEIVRLLSGIVVVGFFVFLIGLAVVIATKPPLAERFLTSFASSARAHYTAQGLRLRVGAAIVNFASLDVVPTGVHAIWLAHRRQRDRATVGAWQWHQRLGTRVMPLVIRHMRLFALGAFALGAFILWAVCRAVIS